AEIDSAFELAGAAAPFMAASTGEDRSRLLNAIADALEEDADVIKERVGLETGYPQARLDGEFGRTVMQLRVFGRVAEDGNWVNARIDTALPDREPLPKPDLRRMLVPVGPVAIFGASNFPLAISVAGGDPASALAAGCPVVTKGHPSHPGSSELVARAVLRGVEQAGFPEGTFSMLQGADNDTGRMLVEHPKACAVAFTGSLRGGRALFDIAAARPIPIPVYAEMGSVNPQFVLPGRLDAGPGAFADGLFASVTMGNGQFCTCPSLVFAPEGESLDEMIGHYLELVSGSTGAPLLNAGIASAFESGIARWQDIEGVEILAQGSLEAAEIGAAPVMARISLEDFKASREMFMEEIFGPSVLVVVCPDKESYVEAAGLFDGQLGTSIHGNEEELPEAGALLAALSGFSGRVCVNGFPTGIEVCDSVHHGGPYPATTDAQHTSIGTAGISRWGRPVSFQNTPQPLLPEALKDTNPLGLLRLVDGVWTRDPAG
ncbi:MAG: aldehyde dehydrogenase (NADP(+)), partial [Verrucomicrobiota bacterium]|nr:aldehyde dehydrogenase (NADP(+)) [Verrucomicrobiota bacterium]